MQAAAHNYIIFTWFYAFLIEVFFQKYEVALASCFLLQPYQISKEGNGSSKSGTLTELFT
jgi:hypothetical protein